MQFLWYVAHYQALAHNSTIRDCTPHSDVMYDSPMTPLSCDLLNWFPVGTSLLGTTGLLFQGGGTLDLLEGDWIDPARGDRGDRSSRGDIERPVGEKVPEVLLVDNVGILPPPLALPPPLLLSVLVFLDDSSSLDILSERTEEDVLPGS
jgi:hypothetical protein